MQKKSNNLIQVIAWKATYNGTTKFLMWQMVSWKLKGTVRQHSVGRNMWFCGFRKSKVDNTWVVILVDNYLELALGNLSGFSFHAIWLPLWLGTIARSFCKNPGFGQC